jgi:predicted transcriptional regulator of viral defense system
LEEAGEGQSPGLVVARAICNNVSEDVNNVRGFIAMGDGQASKMNAALQLVKERGTVRPRDLVERDIPPDYLDRLHRRGLVERVARGIYAWPEAEVSEHHTLAEAARQVSRGVVCLLSALRFHGLTAQSPHEVWLALPPKAWSPRGKYPKLRIMRFSGPALTEMVEEHPVEGVAVKVYTAAKTVADCFKFRNKVGNDVGVEALRDCWRSRKATMDELWAAARICRMTNVMRPYLESIA